MPADYIKNFKPLNLSIDRFKGLKLCHYFAPSFLESARAKLTKKLVYTSNWY